MRLRMAIHLLFCRICRRYARQLRWLQRAVAAAPKMANPSQILPETGRNRLKAALKQELAANPAPGTQPLPNRNASSRPVNLHINH